MPPLTDQRRDRVARMRLAYGFTQPLGPSLDDGGGVAQQWRVVVSEGEQEDGTAGPPVATIRVVRAVLGDPQLWYALDAMEADLETVASTILDLGTGELVGALDELIEPADELVLILNSVVVEPDWRGFGLGALLAGVTLQTLGPGARLAAMYLAPLHAYPDGERAAGVAKQSYAGSGTPPGTGGPFGAALVAWRG